MTICVWNTISLVSQSFYGLFNFLVTVDFLYQCQYGEDLGALLNIEVDENDGVQYKDFDLKEN